MSHTLARYGLAVLSAMLAAGLRLALTPFFGDRNELVMFYPSIMVSAWLGGLWPGVVATLASAALVGYLFLEPLFTLRVEHHGDTLALAIFVVTGIIISILNEHLRRNALREQHAHADAEQARADAYAANRTKDFFIAAVAHDLRAPMTAALGWAEILGKNPLDHARHEHAIVAIRRSVKRQLALVSDLLDTAAVLSGTLRIERSEVSLAGVVRAAAEIAEPLAAQKGVHLGLDPDAEDAIVFGNASRLQQVVSNLLMNAIKFTAEGGTVRVRLLRSRRYAELRVIDTGKGIRAAALPLIFDQFWQAEHSATGSSKGVGLGLSIAKHLVTAHGGTIHATSESEGKGATFTVRLPLAATSVSTETPSSHQDQRGDGAA